MKRWFVCGWIVALCLGLFLYSCAAEKPAAPEVTQPQETQPAAPEEVPPVRIYLRDEENTNRAAWESIMKAYQRETGVEILIWDEAQTEPAIVIGQAPAAENCVDLSGTAAYAQLVSWELAMRNEGKVCAIATGMEGYGLLCNPWLLGGAYSLSEISGLDKLEEVVQYIEGTGLSAFAAPAPEELAAGLAMLPEDGYDFAKLYVSHMAEFAEETENAGAQQLHDGKAVFCLGGTGDCIHAEDGDTAILPIYLGRENEENSTLFAVGSRYLWINSEISPEEQEAALAFLDDLVMPEENGTVPLDTLQRISPFRQTTYADNALEQVLRRDLTAGKSCMVGNRTETATQEQVDALMAFVEEPTEENWLAFRLLWLEIRLTDE